MRSVEPEGGLEPALPAFAEAEEAAAEPAEDEADLIAATQQGDLSAFNELVRRYQTLAFNVAARILGDREVAADVVQDSFLSAWEHIRGFRGTSFRAWLLRIVTNRCYDRLRRQKVRQAASIEDMLADDEGAELPEPSEGPEGTVLRQELRAMIQRGILTLPPEQRAVLVLCDVQGLSYEETAQATSASIGTVKSRLSRARDKLRQYLRAEGELLPARYRQG